MNPDRVDESRFPAVHLASLIKQAFESGVGLADFGVGPAVCTADQTVEESEADRAALVASARQALRRELDAERATLLETLEDDGRTAAAMLAAGPDDSETVGRLMAAGLIPMAGMSTVFPDAHRLLAGFILTLK